MAFDDKTRNRLQKLVSDCRGLLSAEFAIQVQQTYGLDPNSGELTPLDRLAHLSDRERHTAQLLRDTLAHYLAGDENDKANRIAAIDRIIREQAFTVLNRLAALLMMEARGLLLPAVSQGQQSQAFELYKMIAGSALGETGDAYRVFLFSLFDEFAQDLPTLFDRFAPQGQLFPREPALMQLIDALKHHEVAPLWAEDETIGWIYQYFNSKDERKKMREASQAPRNSRELAVRNQFFTPRYVVEFLVDNTLGRLWFNATGGHTGLRERCQYLLVKPDEAPPAAVKLRDPRTLKLLDPACGSMHFGLYAFDLFLEIYREAWDWEQTYGPGSLDLSTHKADDLRPLCQTYADADAFSRDVPRLIIEHNLHGVDIDPRAAQIASLALWLRAQRAWHEAGTQARDRPAVGQGHVLAAVAPPAEKELRQRFMAELDGLDAELFEQTLFMLKGLPELGVLLQVERELPQLIRKVFGEHGSLFKDTDTEQWSKAETRLRAALTEFALAARASYQGRLFAQDALQGLRLIDLTREVFDVVVMNPPFGDPSRSTKSRLEESFSRSKGNILAHFIERASQMVRPGGRVGAIVSRTCFFLQSFSEFRKTVLSDDLCLEGFADLGLGVLDAMVETAAATWERKASIGNEATFFREVNRQDKESGLLDSIAKYRAGKVGLNYFVNSIERFRVFDDAPYVYWIDEGVMRKIAARQPVEPLSCSIRVGLQTGDDFRFLRLWWEVRSADLITPRKKIDMGHLCQDSIELSQTRKWAWYSKTESASPVISSIHVCVNWLGNGKERKSYHVGNGHSSSKYVMSESMYFRPGLSYMLRSSRLVPYIVPMGVIPTAGRSQVYPKEGLEIWLTALLSSNFSTAIARFRGESFWGPKFQNSMVSAIPFLKPSAEAILKADSVIGEVRKRAADKLNQDEAEILFTTPFSQNAMAFQESFDRISLLGVDLDDTIAKLCDLSHEEFQALQRDHNEALVKPASIFDGDDSEEIDGEQSAGPMDDQGESHADLSWAVGVAFGRFDIRLATGERAAPPEPEPFDPLPAKSPGMLPDGDAPFHADTGILVDDPGHAHDLVRVAERVLERVDMPVPAELRRWLQKDFFPFHLQRYSKSRRKAPIYWPLSTASGSYTLWLYYPSLTSQTLYTAINDFVEPKLAEVETEAATLRTKGSARSRDEEKRLEALTTLEAELRDLRDQLQSIAPHYQPNHDDGVQITAAPLWPLFRHKPWQKLLKDTWAKLEKGDYDWAHLAMSYWPERVREKCRHDKSLAIAHGLEELYVEPPSAPKKARGRKKEIE